MTLAAAPTVATATSLCPLPSCDNTCHDTHMNGQHRLSRATASSSSTLAALSRQSCSTVTPGTKSTTADPDKPLTTIPSPPLFEIRASALGGLGVFALHDIPEGQVVLAEHPLLYADRITLYEEVDKLDPSARDKFDSLHVFRRTAGTDDIAGRFWTNCFNTVLGSGIFPVAARFNHSCKGHNNVSFTLPTIRAPSRRAIPDDHTVLLSPSTAGAVASTSWGEKMTTNDDKIILAVSKPGGVKAGDELTINYGHLPDTLSENWGFQCRCAGCRIAAAAAAVVVDGAASGGRRKRTKHLGLSKNISSSSSSSSGKSQVDSPGTDSTSSDEDDITTATATSTSSAHFPPDSNDADADANHHRRRHHRTGRGRTTCSKTSNGTRGTNTIFDARHPQQPQGEAWKTLVPGPPLRRHKAGHESQW